MSSDLAPRFSGANSDRGHTIAELLVASAIMLLIVGATITTFVFHQRHAQRISARLELQQQSLSAVSHLNREMAESNPFTVDCSQADCIIFPLPRDASGDVTVDAAGNLLWSKLVCYRILDKDGAKRLVRQEEILASPGPTLPEPLEMSPPRDKAYFETHGSPDRVVAPLAIRLVAQQKIDSAGEPEKDYLVTLTSRVVIGGKALELDARTGVLPRN